MNLQRQSYFSVSSEGVPIRNTADYSPFGVQLDGRTIQGDNYRYGYQGSEKDDEAKGGGNSYTTEFRQLDSRIGRWLSIDPLMAKFPWQSTYSSMDNNPIWFNDPLGLETDGNTKGDEPKQTIGTEKNPIKLNEVPISPTTGVAGFVAETKKAVTMRIPTSISNSDSYSTLKGVNSSSVDEGFKFNWYTPTSKGNTIAGTIGTSLDIMGAIKNDDLYKSGFRLGLNGNYQLTGRNASLFKNAPIKPYTTPISKISKIGGLLGKVSVGFGIGIDAIGVYNYYKIGKDDPNSVHPAKAAVNTGFGILGIGISRIGIRANPLAAILYFGVDSFYPGGWIGDKNHPGAFEDRARIQELNREIVPNFNLNHDMPGGF